MTNRISTVEETLVIFESSKGVEFVLNPTDNPRTQYYSAMQNLKEHGYWEEFKKQHPIIAEVMENTTTEPLQERRLIKR